jgi:hypothetical protein
MDYRDFVLQLDRAPGDGDFVARVIRSPAGEAEAPFVNPVSPAELDGLWRAALAARQAQRARAGRDLVHEGFSRPDDLLSAERSLEDLGGRLFKALFRGHVRSCWASSLAELAQDPSRGLRLKLHLDIADPLLAPLAELPWEYLFSLEQGGFLALQRKTPVLRHLRLPSPVVRLPAAQPLRVLIVSSQPTSMAQLDLRQEAERIAAALGSMAGVEALWLEEPSIETLRETLLRRDFHVLHLMGHGGFDAESGQGVLYFADSHGAPLPVSGTLLASHLTGLLSLRLAFVNACETACGSSRAPFAGVAAALLRAGLPAVVAMQRPIRDDSALEFSRTVYRRLAAGDPIDAAVTEGRLAIARGRGALLEWGTPVLFSRAEDGRLFAAEPAAAPGGRAAPLPPPQPAAPVVVTAARSERPFHLYLLAAALAAGLGVASTHWPIGAAGAPKEEENLVRRPAEGTTDLEAEGPSQLDSQIAEGPAIASKGLSASPPPPNAPERAQERSSVEHSAPAPRGSSSYEVTQHSPASIPGLGADVGVRFFERSGRSLARFWVEPAGEARLEQPPILSPRPISFAARNGTYHLEVLSMDPAERRARVRVRFLPAS